MSDDTVRKGIFHRPVLRVVVIVTWVVVLALGALLTLKVVRERRLAETFSVALRQTDAALAARDSRGATDSLRNASRSAQTAGQWLSILKRARSASAERPSPGAEWQLVEELGTAAVRAFPGNQELWAILIWAQMKDGNTTQAAREATRYLADERFQSLRVEALLRSSGVAGPVEEKGNTRDDLKLLTSLSASTAPADFRAAGDVTSDRRFYLDMVLLEARQSVDQALRDFGRLQLGEVAPHVGVLLAYDSGDFDTARAYMRMLPAPVVLGPEMVMLQADMFMAEGKLEDAAQLYKALIRDQPDVSTVPYQNLAYIEAESQRAAEASEPLPPLPAPTSGRRLPLQLAPQGNKVAAQLLARASSAFPNDPELIRARAQVDLARKQRDLATSLVDNYLAEHPQDPTMRLFRIAELMPDAPPERITALLWDLLNAYPDNALAGQLLARRLLTVRDLNALQALIQRYDPTPEWLRFYQGVVDATRGNTENARAVFTDIWNRKKSWQAAYDVGLTYLQEGSILPAMHAFDQAEQAADNAASVGGFRSVRGFGPEPEDRGLLEYYRAETLASQAEFDRAMEAAQRAAAFAPDNIDVSVLVRKLAAAIQR